MQEREVIKKKALGGSHVRSPEELRGLFFFSLIERPKFIFSFHFLLYSALSLSISVLLLLLLSSPPV